VSGRKAINKRDGNERLKACNFAPLYRFIKRTTATTILSEQATNKRKKETGKKILQIPPIH
jgi:hypothetical protein